MKRTKVPRNNKHHRTSNLCNFDIKEVKPLTQNQTIAFEHYYNGKHLLLHGEPGTGKTFLALYLFLADLIKGNTDCTKLVIVRSSTPTKDIGFLPGNEQEKLSVYQAPYQAIISELTGRDDAYSIMTEKRIIQFESTSFLRGTTIDDSLILFDEYQNATDIEMHTVLTRLGSSSRIILAGDEYQNDLSNSRHLVSSARTVQKILGIMPSVATIKFDIDDIVRSGFCKEYLVARSSFFNRTNPN